ncbi:acetyltransferase [Algoriphagus antarcticus]|uniref:Acetyltransferase EpsM n=1 Tax=Algoriphagus antarcticus TaxID=238540 RepID=A0A3E0DZW6_9BACT|nr:acetyltransferase [Algoriphagus antarcticus]REG91511.1 acetyltransferase EpsM [Algoriphagus antarcticus]
MIVAGAGGHAIEILDILTENGEAEDLYFFDNQNENKIFLNSFHILNTYKEAKEHFQKDPRFVLGIGKPEARQILYTEFQQAGGILQAIRGSNAKISQRSQISTADIFNFCYIGGEVQIGTGSLINTGAQIHHEVQIGDFSVINPGAILLGACQIGDFCSIGAHATILPRIRIGNRVTIGAGAVIIRDVEDGQTVMGVPGRVISRHWAERGN